ncbi:MAG: hypothetical protein ACI9TH_000014 [Kiritimatiellia bacterium]|jgi:hypothetical protein
MLGTNKGALLAIILVLWAAIAFQHQRKPAAEAEVLASPARIKAEVEPLGGDQFMFKASADELAVQAMKQEQVDLEQQAVLERARIGRNVSDTEVDRDAQSLTADAREVKVSDLHIQAIQEMAETGFLEELFINQTRILSELHNPSSPDGKFDPERIKQMELKGELSIF